MEGKGLFFLTQQKGQNMLLIHTNHVKTCSACVLTPSLHFFSFFFQYPLLFLCETLAITDCGISKVRQCLRAHLSGFLSRLAQTLR